MTGTQNSKISIRNLKKAFGKTPVLQGVDLDIPAGKTTVILGGSGSGKSVLLKCILGLLEPDSGQVLIDGKNTTHLREAQRYDLMLKFGMLFQSGALFDSMAVWENVTFSLLKMGKPADECRKIAVEKLAMVGLGARVADLMPADLSGGMRKRAALARSICLEPEIIFYDEPTTGLDPIMSDVINDLILDLSQKLGITSVVITHDMKSAFKIADYVAMLYQGKIIAHDSVEKFRRLDDPRIKQFVTGSAQGPISTVNL